MGKEDKKIPLISASLLSPLRRTNEELRDWKRWRIEKDREGEKKE